MHVAYHPNGAALTAYALNLWLTAALAAVPTAPAGEIVTVPVPGILLDLGLPNYPWQVETDYLSDDRETQGGKTYSRIRAERRQGRLNFSGVPSCMIDQWRAWHVATRGGRIPFIVQLPDLSAMIAVAPGSFPLSLVSMERWAGSLAVRETPL